MYIEIFERIHDQRNVHYVSMNQLFQFNEPIIFRPYDMKLKLIPTFWAELRDVQDENRVSFVLDETDLLDI